MVERRRVGRPKGRPPKTREEIAAAAGRVFREVGYHEARMDDVARELGIAKGSLYYYVATKEELLFEVILPPYRDAVAHLDLVARSDAPVPKRIEVLVYRHLMNVADFYPAISIYLEHRRYLPVPHEVRRLDHQYNNGVRAIVVDGMRDGSLRVQDPAVATAALLGMCNWFAVNFEPADGWNVDEVARGFAALFLHGVAERPAGVDAR